MAYKTRKRRRTSKKPHGYYLVMSGKAGRVVSKTKSPRLARTRANDLRDRGVKYVRIGRLSRDGVMVRIPIKGLQATRRRTSARSTTRKKTTRRRTSARRTTRKKTTRRAPRRSSRRRSSRRRISANVKYATANRRRRSSRR